MPLYSGQSLHILGSDAVSGAVILEAGAGMEITQVGDTFQFTMPEELLTHSAHLGLSADDHLQYINLSPATTARNLIEAAADICPSTIKGYSSQTQPLQQWMNTSETVLTKILASGTLGLPDGSVSLPSAFFLSETNTGFYRRTANNLAFAVQGLSAFDFIRDTTSASYINVGLGTQASVSDQYGLLVARTLANTFRASFQNASTNAASATVLEVKAHNSTVWLEIAAWNTGTSVHGYQGRGVVRASNTASKGLSLIANGGGGNDIRIYSGGVTVTDERFRIDTNQLTLDFDGTITPDAKLCFEVTGTTTRASKPYPTLTTVQRDAIVTPTAGSMIYNSTTGVMNYYTGAGAWAAF